MGKLRQIIAEEIARDPFKVSTVFDTADPTIKAKNVIKDSLVPTLMRASQSAKNKSVKDAMTKAVGLAQHAMQDLQAIETLINVAVEAHRKN